MTRKITFTVALTLNLIGLIPLDAAEIPAWLRNHVTAFIPNEEGELVAVWIESETFSDAELGKLLAFHHLQILGLNAPAVTNSGMNLVARFPELRFLGIEGTEVCGRDTIESLRVLEKLEEISFRRMNLSVELLDALPKLEALKSLELRECTVNKQAAACLGKLSTLSSFRLSLTDIADRELTFLTTLVNLEELYVSFHESDGDYISNLSNCMKLKVLKILHSPLTRHSLLSIGTLSTLEHLVLVRVGLDDAALESIGRVRGLVSLNVASNPKITNDGLSNIVKLQRLAELDVSNKQLSSSGVTHIVVMKNLKTLRLAFSGIGDADIEQLVRLDKLESLDLSHTQVTDKCVEHLAKMKKLRSVRLESVNMSETAIKALQRARPNLDVVFSQRIRPITDQ